MGNGAATGLATGSILISLVIGLAVLILAIVIWWKIWSKAGYSGAMGLLMFIPIVNIIMIFVFAFGEWPIHRELQQLRAQAMMRGPQPGAPYPPQPYPPQYPPQY